MKKALALLLVLLLTVPAVFVSADGYDLILEASTSIAELGDTVNVTVKLNEMNGVNSIGFKMRAEERAFLMPDISEITVEDSNFQYNTPAIEDGYITFNFSRARGISSSGELLVATVPFTVVDSVEAKSYKIRIYEAFIGTGEPVVKTDIAEKKLHVYVNGTQEPEVVVPVAPAAPAAPVVSMVGTNFVELAEIQGAEYCVDDNVWQDSRKFENLEAGKTYKFYARIKAVGDTPASDASPALEYFLKSIRTAPSKPEVKSKTETSVTLKEISGAIYRVNDGEWQESNVFTGLTTGTSYKFYAKYVETDEYFESSSSEALTVRVSSIGGGAGGGGGGGGSDEEDVTDEPEIKEEEPDKNVESSATDGNLGKVTVDGAVVDTEITKIGVKDSEYGTEYSYSVDTASENIAVALSGMNITDANKDSIVAFVKNADGTITVVPETRVDKENGTVTFVTDKASGKFYVINNAVSFKDKADIPSWAAGYINALSSRGIINGDSGNFAPNRNITRAELAAILVRAFGLEGDASDMAFADVAEDAWYHGVVAAAYANGIINGTSETTFAPDAPVTREQMATMLSRVASNQTIDLPKTKEYEGFADEATFGSYAVEHIEKLYSAGIINGKDAGNFDALGNATRAEVSKVVWGIFDLSF